MWNTLKCFFTGHSGEVSLFESDRSAMFGGSLWPRELVYCERCEDILNTRWPLNPPEEEPHRVETFESNKMYRAACWCGWRCETWRYEEELAYADGEIHLES